MPSHEELVLIQQKLRQIPHLDLGISIDHETLKKEFLGCPELLPYRSNSSDEKVREIYSKAWSGTPLIGFVDEVYDGSIEIDKDPIINHRGGEPTYLEYLPAADQCPYAMKLTRQLQGIRLDKSRFTGLNPHSSLTYHSHVLFGKQPEKLLIVQVPVIMPDGVSYNVTNASNYDSTKRQIINDDKVVKENYALGNAYVFNNYLFHNVFNDSDQQRIVLLVLACLECEYLFELVTKATDKYTGPYIIN